MARVPVIEVAPGLFRIPTIGAANTNSFAVADDDGGVTLVDCGLRWAPRTLVAGLRAAGYHAGDVRRIVLTHAHTDHAGGAAEMAARTGAPVAAHEADAAALEAGRHPPYDRTLRAGRVMARMPGSRFPPVRVDERLTDGVRVGGLRIVSTPGHTPGSICLLHEPSGTLVVGDTLMHRRRLRFAPRAVSTDFRLGERAARVLGDLEYERVAFTHGTEITVRARETILALVTGGGGG